MVKTIIPAFPTEKRNARIDDSYRLNIAENFCDTIQGENFAGYPCVFLRLQNCTLNCTWCDTTEVWRKGNPYSVRELLELWEETGVIHRFRKGHHLVITGGSPLLQMGAIENLIDTLDNEYHFRPFIEIENECVLRPSHHLIINVDRWNNSPKLANSGMKKNLCYKPDLIRDMASLPASDFKFVISSKEDWDEIQTDYLDTDLIMHKQIVLMPEGSTREQLQAKYDMVVDLCCEKGVRMSDRMQVTIWDKTVGV